MLSKRMKQENTKNSELYPFVKIKIKKSVSTIMQYYNYVPHMKQGLCY